MNVTKQNSIIKTMVELIDQKRSTPGENGQLTVSHYYSEDRLNQEIESLFNQQPILAAHASQLAEPGSYITLQIGHRPVIINRDRHGKLNAFINACRHRGAKLIDKPCGKAKVFKCPYHAWAYQDNGELIYVPNQDVFEGLDKSQHSLKKLNVIERAGFIWLLHSDKKTDISKFLQEIDNELIEFGLENHVVRVSDIQTPNCNWKLIMDAFSEGYHLKSLHKHSVEPYFQEHGVYFEKRGVHSLSVGARNEILQAHKTPEKDWNFRAWTTAFYNIFPNTILVFHPDWISRITVFPNGPSRSTVYHDMLIARNEDLEAPYWDKTFDLINKQVFAAEDIAVCESIQSTIRSNTDTHWPIGELETPVKWFHHACEEAIQSNR